MIRFNQVTKQFDQSSALHGVSFSIDPGELVLITGPSGSGKTTLMRLLTKVLEPSSGEIEFDGQTLTQIRPNRVHLHRRAIGVVFQDYNLLPDLNVWENIALALSIIGKDETETEQRVTDLLELIQLSDKAFLFPSQLSGGEAQRVSIARALAPAPKVIFADEPTGNLDPQTSDTIARLLAKINELGTTLLLATHDTGVLDRLANHRRLQLDKGKLIADSKQPTVSKTKTKHQASVPAKTNLATQVAKPNQPEESASTGTQAEPITNPTPTSKPLAEPEATPPKATTRFGSIVKRVWPFGREKVMIPPAKSETISQTELESAEPAYTDDLQTKSKPAPKKRSTTVESLEDNHE